MLPLDRQRRTDRTLPREGKPDWQDNTNFSLNKYGFYIVLRHALILLRFRNSLFVTTVLLV